jgi:hypothetical protein
VLKRAGVESEMSTVLDALFADVRAHGAAAIKGRVEGNLSQPLARRRGLLTRMDRDWWMGHHIQAFTQP